MAKVGAQRAAELTGTSKSTIQRAMNKGRLSFEVDPAGRRIIDVSELERVFGIQSSSSSSNSASVEQELEKASSMLETERLKMRIKSLEDQLDTTQDQIKDLKEQRDQWQRQASQVLITSQYSQKQAEELRAEIKEREQRARERRQQEQQAQLESRVHQLKTTARNENRAIVEDDSFNFKGLWKRVKGARA